MIYIPDEWLVKEENKEKVHEIISSVFFTDVNLTTRVGEVIYRLDTIGENKIAGKIRSGELKLNC